MNIKILFARLLAILGMSMSAMAQIQAGRAINITITGVPNEDGLPIVVGK